MSSVIPANRSRQYTPGKTGNECPKCQGRKTVDTPVFETYTVMCRPRFGRCNHGRWSPPCLKCQNGILPSGKPCSTCRGTGIFDKIEETCKICNGTGIYPKPVQKRVGFKAQACGVCEAVGRVIFLNPVLKEEHVAVLLAR